MPTAQAPPPFVLSDADRSPRELLTRLFSLQTNPTQTQIAILNSLKPYWTVLYQDPDLAPIYRKLAFTFAPTTTLNPQTQNVQTPQSFTPQTSNGQSKNWQPSDGPSRSWQLSDGPSRNRQPSDGPSRSWQLSDGQSRSSNLQSWNRHRSPTRRKDSSSSEDHFAPGSHTGLLIENGFRAFIIMLNTGINLPQLTGTLDIVEFFCRLSEDIQRLIVTQKDGTIVEFPFVLFARTSIQRRGRQQKIDAWRAREAIIAQLIPFDDQMSRPAHHVEPTEDDLQPDHVVFIDFTQRRLAFVFYTQSDAIRFHCYIIFLAKLSKKTLKDGASCINRCTTPTSPISCALLPGSVSGVSNGVVSTANSVMRKSGVVPKAGAKPSGLIFKLGDSESEDAVSKPDGVILESAGPQERPNSEISEPARSDLLVGPKLKMSSLGHERSSPVRRLSSSTRSSALDAATEVVLTALCHRSSKGQANAKGSLPSACSLLGDLASGTVIEFSSRERPA